MAAKRILFLTQKMTMGFGVAVVVYELARSLIEQGVDVRVGCLEHDDSMSDVCPVLLVQPDANALSELVHQYQITHLVAHTSPFFEILPQIKNGCKKVVWEHGDPTPELFPFDGAERKAIADRKRQTVYPNVDQVVAISEFIRSDIRWPGATIIHNGCDHIKAKGRQNTVSSTLKVGALMRVGVGESYYKGNELYLQLAQAHQDNPKVNFYLMGRGAEKDAAAFVDAGVVVHLNASDEERERYLSSMDIIVSMSLWEGFNLPLAEAALSGAIPLALDTGAHPEVTPFIFSSVAEMDSFIRSLMTASAQHRSQIATDVKSMIEKRFRWEESARTALSQVLC